MYLFEVVVGLSHIDCSYQLCPVTFITRRDFHDNAIAVLHPPRRRGIGERQPIGLPESKLPGPDQCEVSFSSACTGITFNLCDDFILAHSGTDHLESRLKPPIGQGSPFAKPLRLFLTSLKSNLHHAIVRFNPIDLRNFLSKKVVPGERKHFKANADPSCRDASSL
jgi:hypothetical protein